MENGMKETILTIPKFKAAMIIAIASTDGLGTLRRVDFARSHAPKCMARSPMLAIARQTAKFSPSILTLYHHCQPGKKTLFEIKSKEQSLVGNLTFKRTKM
jgi:hypothetical protein